MLNYHHQPTGTRIATDTGTTTTSGHPFNEVHVATPFVSTRVTHYDSLGGWQAQSVHLHASEAEAKVQLPDDDRKPYLVVKVGTHDNIFVPMEIAEAIVDAMLDDEAAAELIHAEEVAS